MNDKMRKALGFLGLVEDDYNEYAATEAPRPFSEDVREEPSWNARSAPARPTAPASRINPTPAPRSGPAGLRPQAAPSRSATTRARMSAGPPAGKGTTMRTG